MPSIDFRAAHDEQSVAEAVAMSERKGRCLHIVLATRGSHSYLDPLLAIAVELIGRGHRVTLATHTRYEPLVLEHGCRYHPLRPEDPPSPSDSSANRSQQKPGSTLRSVLFAHVEDTYRDLLSASDGADLLVGHHILLPLEMAATRRGIPWVPLYFAPCALNSVYDPPVFSMLPRLHGLQRKSHHVAAALNSALRRLTQGWYEPYRALRARENFPPEHLNYILDGAQSPHLNLAMFSPLLGTRQPDWNPRTEITGFPFLRETSGMEHENLQDFISEGSPPLVATLGSSGTVHTRHFFQNSLQAARRLGERIVLITGSLPEGCIEPLDKSFAFSIPYAPYRPVFQRARAVLHSGAIGATAETLRAGKPMLVVPAFAADQPDNAVRAVRLGVARTLSMSSYTADAATASLRALLNSPRYAESASSIGERVRQKHGAACAADLLERTAWTGAIAAQQAMTTSQSVTIAL